VPAADLVGRPVQELVDLVHGVAAQRPGERLVVDLLRGQPRETGHHGGDHTACAHLRP
jgi:hypothetical protein